MTDYCVVADLDEVRTGMSTSYGISDFSSFIEEAGSYVDRAVTSRWYREAAAQRGIDMADSPFNRDNLPSDGLQLKKAAVYKTLSDVFFYLAKIGNSDSFSKESSLFEDKFEKELSEVLKFGISYDWDEDDEEDSSELYVRAPRRLKRC